MDTKIPSRRCDLYRPSQFSRERSTLRKIIGIKAWAFLNNTLYRWSPSQCRGFRRFLAKSFGCALATDSSLSNKATITCPWNLKIGGLSSIGDRAWVYSLDRITIGDKTCIGNAVQLLTGTHDITSPTFAFMQKPITIGSCVWIASSVIILPGVTVGEGAVIGAGSVVVKDVAPWTVVAGNPAREIKKRILKDEETHN